LTELSRVSLRIIKSLQEPRVTTNGLFMVFFPSSSSSACLRQNTFKNKKASPLDCTSNRRNQEATCCQKQRLLSRRNKPFFLGSWYVLSMAWFVERSLSLHPISFPLATVLGDQNVSCGRWRKKELQGCWRQVVCGEIGLNKLKRSRTHKWTPGRFGQTQMR